MNTQEVDYFHFITSTCPGLLPAKFSNIGSSAEGKSLGSSREWVLSEE